MSRKSALTIFGVLMCASTIVGTSPFSKTRKASIKLVIDFRREIGKKKLSAQLTKHYKPDELVGRQVAAVINSSPRQKVPVMCEVLTLGFSDGEGAVVLIVPIGKCRTGAACSDV